MRALAAIARRRLSPDSPLRRVVRTVRSGRRPAPMAAVQLLDQVAALYPTAFFIEIGANDGEQYDYLRQHILARNWSGIMVEPVPYVFERLRRNYGSQSRVILEQVAVGDEDGERTFHHLAEADDESRRRLPGWYDGIGSFHRDEVAGHVAHIPDIEARILTTTVPCVTFETLCRRHDVDRIDVLLIDVEGYDNELIRTIDLARRRPRLLVYEHYHMTLADRAACRDHLHRHGYETMEEGMDTYCVDVGADPRLTRIWRRLRPMAPGVSTYDAAG